MKFRFIYTFSSLLFLAFLFTSSSGGRAGAANWGNTGAPGDQTLTGGTPRTCISCHGSSTSIQVDLNIDIRDSDNNSVNDIGYIPGETYTVEVDINTTMGSPVGFGFQMLALNAPLNEDGSEVSDWQAISSNVKVSSAANTGRTYVEHSGVGSNSTFQMSWTAPDDLEGEVTFYSCGNGVNDNGSTSGDNAACNTLVLQQNVTSSSEDLAAIALQMKAFPNPASDRVNLEILAIQSGTYQIQVFNAVGQRVYQNQVSLISGENQESIDLSNLSQGVYTLQVQNEAQVIAQNIVKL